jgi:hypothetical protein
MPEKLVRSINKFAKVKVNDIWIVRGVERARKHFVGSN